MALALEPGYLGSLGETVLRPATARRALTDIFSVVEGIKGKQLVTFLERGGLATTLDPGCGLGIQPVVLGNTGYTWNPYDMKAWISECWTTARGRALEHSLKAGNDKKDLTGTTYGDYMVDVLEEIVANDLIRMASFADPDMLAANLTASVTINGVVYTAAQLLKFFKTFPGLWKRTFQAVASAQTPYVDISGLNAPAGAQTINYETEIMPLFRNIMNAATAELSAQPLANQRLFVTQPLYNAFQDYRESRNLSESFQLQADGTTRPTYRSVAIVPMPEWTQNINTFFKVGTTPKPDKPLRALLTVVGNYQLGFDAMPLAGPAAKPDLEVFTDLMSETWNARCTYTADQQIADPKLVVAAY